MQFSIRSLLWIVVCIAIFLTGIRGCNRLRMRADVLSLEAWPVELKTLVSDLALDTTDVDVRIGPEFVSYFWKMKNSQRAFQHHIDRFQLVPVNVGGSESRFIRENFPRAWDWPEHLNYRCFAKPVGMPYIPDGGRLVIMFCDDDNEMIYCFYHFNI